MKNRRELFPKYGREVLNLSEEQAVFFIRHLRWLTPVFTECFYVLDMQQKQFCYIKPDNLFLCGFSVEEALRDGYDFYSKIIYPEDLSLWTDMRRVVLRYLKDFEASGDVDYFSCTFRLQRYFPTLSSRPFVQMIYHRMKPVWVDNKPRYLMCSIQDSTIKEAGHLCVYHKDGRTYEAYRFATKRWEQKVKMSLAECERAILMFSKQGKNCKEIAGLLFKSQHTIHNQLQSLYSKLDVHTMREAIEFADYHQLINPSWDIASTDIIPHEKRDKLSVEDVRQRIQLHLADAKSIRQAARMENVAESTVRSWIKTGKLKLTK